MARKLELYRLTFPNGKAYIGISTKSAKDRFRSHRYAFEKGENKSIIYRAWRVHGEPVMEVIGTFETVDQLRAAEREAIASFGTLKPQGYNMTPGGDANPMDVPEIAKRVGLMNRGKKAKPETKAKLSAMRTGKPLAPNHRAAIGEGQRGRIHSEDTRRKIAEKAIGRRWSDEQRAAASKARKGQSRENYPRDEATKQRQSEAAKLRWQRLRADKPETLQAAIARQAQALRESWARRKGNAL